MTLSACGSNLELLVFYLSIILFISAFVSTIIVFKNGNNDEKYGSIISEILGPFYTLLSRKYLNSLGKKWWPVLVISWTGYFLILLLSYFLKLC